MKLRYISFLIVMCFSWNAKAQDPIFTQYFMVPETLNPGFTGFLETTNAGIMHRSQWTDLDFKIDTDFGFINTWVEPMNSGVGVSVLSHREKFTNYNFTQVNVNYAYRVELTDEWYFRPAIEIGFGNKSYGFQNLILEDQINIGNGTISSVSMDPTLLKEKVNFFDFSAGFLFNNENTWFGLSMKHLNKPNITFTQQGNLPLEMFFSANAGIELELKDYMNTVIFPFETKLLLTANYMKQAEYNRLDIGAGLVFKKFFVGATAATDPVGNSPNSHFLTSLNPYGGLYYDHFKFGYSYDFNTSKIGRTGGVHEFSITYQFDLDVKCLGCPEYY